MMYMYSGVSASFGDNQQLKTNTATVPSLSVLPTSTSLMFAMLSLLSLTLNCKEHGILEHAVFLLPHRHIAREKKGGRAGRKVIRRKCREVRAGFTPLLPSYSTTFLNFLSVNLHNSVPLCRHPVRERLSSVPSGVCDCRHIDYFLSLSFFLYHTLFHLFPSFCLPPLRQKCSKSFDL